MSLQTINRLFLFLTLLFTATGPANAQAAPSGCDDGDPCTVDVEDICGNCFHIKVDCADLVCDDGNPCTVDVVDINGNCLHFPKNCDDGNPATHDYCDNWGICRHEPIDCDDNDPNTMDYVGPDGQCHHVRQACCDDNNPCTEDVYNPQTGECVHLPRCDDGDPCTVDYCDPQTGQCIHKPRNCDDGDPCTIDYCDPQTGQCVHQPKNCDDGDPCTIDLCNPYTGACIHKPDPNCNPCQGVNCNDGDPCTIDYCDPQTGQCIHKPRNCDDGDPCTIDSCNPYTGACIHKPDPNCTPCQGVNCDDGNPCTIDYCNPYTGACIHKPRNCDDGNPCTIDSCNPYTGACMHKPDPNCNPCYGVNCDDGDPCTIDTCDPYTGACVHTPSPNCQLACSFTMGFWGNPGGSFNGQTTTQILQGILTNGPLVVGVVGYRSISISQANLSCIFELLPGGGNAAALPANMGDIMVQSPSCDISPIPSYSDGRIQNILLAQAMTLALNVRYDPNLANLPLSQACFSFPWSVLNSLPANPTVLDLLNHANRVLAGLANTTPTTINSAVATINEYFDECSSICVAANSPGSGDGPSILPDVEAASAFAERGFLLYPNPASGEVMADLKQYQGMPATLHIYSMLGGLVHEQEVAELPVGPVRISLPGLSSGIYFMKVRIAGEQELGKEFVISRK
ncbi:MAG: T9SS type A sorting domain-containing protein [Phaeodactylibacter sp.]|nr:T9SS type A sorting domain-containing protein [Phaeodactylibacter sp.]MCB9048966.1 T9SS type A sorting domain-containing protein [Lewinellaceae bacterium]